MIDNYLNLFRSIYNLLSLNMRRRSGMGGSSASARNYLGTRRSSLSGTGDDDASGVGSPLDGDSPNEESPENLI